MKNKLSLLKILKEILVESLEIKNYALESLIEKLEEEENAYEKNRSYKSK